MTQHLNRRGKSSGMCCSMKVPDGMVSAFREKFEHSEPASVVRAPGRVEVLGNHTDYNGGMVLAASIDRYIWVIGTASDTVKLYSQDYDESVEFDPNNLVRTPSTEWSDYARGVFWALQRRRHKVGGISAVIHGDVPIGAGLSSSAALEVALTNLILELGGTKLNPKAAAMIAFEAERLYCGISCGVMDQFTSQLCKPNSLLAINCANLQTRDVPISNDCALVVIESGISRSASDVLNQRRNECLTALQQLQEADWEINSLGSISIQYLERVNEILEEPLVQRVRHVVLENARVHKGITSLQRGDIQEFGDLMYASHESSRDLYEVSHERLDRLVEIVQTMDGVIGARLTGAGLGGSVLALVKRTYTDGFIKDIQNFYGEETGETVEVIRSNIPGGVTVTSFDQS